ncbi:MAG: tetratricopeptide repeat protein [Magnetococcales bacterium]|nr:tetratricopeptide repeat protein [Magnetococcales bacterium]
MGRRRQHRQPAALDSALKAHREGDWSRAEALYRTILQKDSANFQAWHLSGMLASETGQPDLAITRIAKAIAIKPDFPEACNNLGHLLMAQGRHSEAVSCLQRAIAIKPDFVAAHYNLGNAFKELGRWEPALASYAHALRLQPDFPEACLNTGSIYHLRGALTEAQHWYRRALNLRKAYPDALTNLGMILQSRGQFTEAIEHYRQALLFRPNNPEALSRWGIALQDMGNLTEAIEKYRQALVLRPQYAEVLSHLGGALLGLEQLTEAVATLERSLAIRPRFPAALANLGSALHKQGRLAEALGWFRKAEEVDPHFAEARFGAGLIHLLQGDYASGFAQYEWRWNTKGFQPHGHTQPQWDGSPLSGGTLLVHCEQGMGDSIQWIRFLPALKERGATVVLYCPAPLQRLFSRVRAVDLVVTQRERIPHCAFQIPLMSLAGVLGTTLETLPKPLPDIAVDPVERQRWTDRLADRPGLKVGLVWRGNPRFKNDHIRSMTAASMAALTRVAGCFFVGLQVDGTEEERALLSGQGNFIDLGKELGDFADTAAVVASLDLVIAVDTAVLHLAGSLGRPTWGLLPFVPDWRWLLDRSDSPWYPTVRLFRQEQPGSWPSVMEAVCNRLERVVAGASLTGTC